MRSKAPLDPISGDLSCCQMWEGFAPCPCKPLVLHASETKHLHLHFIRWQGGQGCWCSCSRSHTLPSPRKGQSPHGPSCPFSLQLQGFYHPPGPTRLQEAKGMLPLAALP